MLNTVQHIIYMQDGNSYSTVLEELKSRGYTHSFFKKGNFIYCKNPDLNFHTHELQIAEVYRAQENGNTNLRSVVYTIESVKLGIKGLLLNDC